jgi:hypothetical protein
MKLLPFFPTADGLLSGDLLTLSLHAEYEIAYQAYEADFLVDTGATDSLASAKALKRMGVRPVGKMAYELADGTVQEYQFGLVQIEFMGEITAGRVITGPAESAK